MIIFRIHPDESNDTDTSKDIDTSNDIDKNINPDTEFFYFPHFNFST